MTDRFKDHGFVRLPRDMGELQVVSIVEEDLADGGVFIRFVRPGATALPPYESIPHLCFPKARRRRRRGRRKKA